MELYDPTVTLTAQNEDGPRYLVGGYLRICPTHLQKSLGPQPVSWLPLARESSTQPGRNRHASLLHHACRALESIRCPMDILSEQLISTIRQAASLLTGPRRRRFQAQVARDYLGGNARLAERVFGWGRQSVELGLHELRTGITCLDRFIDRGRRPIEIRDPGIITDLERILEYEVAGDPTSEKKWVRASLSYLSKQLKEAGHEACPHTVRDLLKRQGFSLKGNERKQGQSRSNCPERDEQFRYMASKREAFKAAGWPIISVDTKKKELIGNFRRPGKTWCKKPTEVNEHDYSSQAECLAVPFGIYNVARNTGYVVVGLSHNTSEFAVSSISRWWQDEGRVVYPRAAELLILADGGGGNGYRSRAWRWNLQVKICNSHRLTVTVCHYPPGCSKWNPVEHRLFSQISNNWAGIPLRSLAIMLGYIRGTTTTTGLTVKAVLDEGIYPKGQKVSWKDVDSLNLTPHEVCPEWNYTIRPSE